MKDNLPKTQHVHERFVINLAPSTASDGTHWTAVRKSGSIALYFDSFGIEPPIELIKYLKNCVIYYNSIQYQDVNCIHCGHLSCFFLISEKCLESLPSVLRKAR